MMYIGWRELIMFEKKVRATFGMYERIPARFVCTETTFEINTDHRSLTGTIPYDEIKFLSVDEAPVGADALFWVLACCFCCIPVIGWLAIPLLYVLRNETVIGITCKKSYFSLHGSGSKLESIWRFLEEQTGKNLHEWIARSGKPSFTDKTTSSTLTKEELVPSTKAILPPTHCPSCGARLESEDTFCSECGAKINLAP